MTYSERKGDLFEADDLDAIAHGVNCRGVMGAGFAKEVSKRWPTILPFFRQLCQDDQLLPGELWAFYSSVHSDDPGGPTIYNLASQRRPGPDAKLRWVASSMAAMLDHAEKRGGIERIGMPRIGCGIGGLEWVEVRMIVELLANESPIDVVVFSL